jgi:hypothetical protein
MPGQLVAVLWTPARTLRALADADRRSLVTATLAAGRRLAELHRRGDAYGAFCAEHVRVDDHGRVWLHPRPVLSAAWRCAAPEVLHGAAPDAAADQYSFAATAIELWPSAVTGRAAVRTALLRALSVSPTARWPRLDELVAALDRGRGRRWWRW